MEIISLLQALYFMNTVLILSCLYMGYQAYAHRKTITYNSLHHLQSHFFIAMFIAISINLFYFKGYIIPMLFSATLLIAHLIKENHRLIYTNQWTPDIKAD